MSRNTPLYRWLIWLARLYVGGLLLFLASHHLSPLPTPKSYSPTYYAADSSLLCAYLTEDDKWRLESRIEQLHPDLIEAILQKEDQYFYWHPGVNPLAVVRALLSNLSQGRRVSGASTLSMQLARMAEPAPRTYGNKLREMFRALQYEWRYPKDRILEMYLSYLPYGGNIEGVHSAAYLYFGRSPEKLSLAQAVLLSVIPNRPNSLRMDRRPQAARQARDKWLGRFEEQGVFSKERIAAALAEPVPSKRLGISPQTPHFCQYLRQRYPSADRLYTSLAPGIQQTCERLLANHVRRARTLGASNGALLVVDNQERKVLAYCGSADFYDDQAQGQVDGVQALRSPGSTLKPAVYALAFDQGRATPRSRLLDLPTNYQGFSPENYDLSYWGESSVHDALAYSRNVPVVRLGQELGLEAVLDGLERAGFSDIRKRREAMGLSVILGGCGVSLEELTRFYSSLARGGQLAPLQYVQEAGESPSVTLFSEGACYLISDILSGLERPDIPQRYLEDTDRPRVAWKTGTSYGRRDAWSIGYTPRYTVGVWMGNFDGRGVPEMSGTSMAVPLLLDVFHAISKGGSWFDLPPGVNERKVCAQSGLSVGPHCQHQIQDFFLTDRSSLQACDRHEVCWISPDSSLRYCPQCLPDSGYAKAVFPRYAPELSLWYEQEGLSVFRAPPHNPACDRRDGGAEGPRILSPSEDFTYYLDPQQPQEIMLQAAADARVNKLYWYVNGRFLKSARPQERVFFLPQGSRLQVSCVDDQGRKSEVSVAIEWF